MWRINRLRYILPNRPFAKTNKDNRAARLVDINHVVDEVNEVLEDIENSIVNSEDTVSAGENVSIEETTNGNGSTDYEVTANVIPSNTVSARSGIVVDPTINLDGSTNYSLTVDLPPSSANTWDLPTVAFVDRVNGNNSTAVIGDGNKPYSRISSALAAGARKLILKPGTYSSTVYIQYNDVEIYAMQGVVFTRGIRLFNPAIVNFRLSGHAVFTGFQVWAFRIASMAPAQVAGETYGQIDIEFDYADNTGGIIALEQDSASPKVNMAFDWAKTSGTNGAGYSVRCVGGMELRMDIKYFIHSQHTIYHIRNGFTGKFILNCPESRIINNYGFNYGNFSRTTLWIDYAVATTIEINGDLYNDYDNYVFGAGCISIASWFIGENTLIINGNLTGKNNMCYFSSYRSAYGNIEINGDIKSGRNAIYDSLGGWNTSANQKWSFNGSNIDSQSHNIVGRGRKFHFKDCSFSVREDGTGAPTAASIITGTEPGSPASQTYLYFYNCIMESGFPSDPATMTFNAFSANFHVGTINTVSNIQIGTGVGAVDDWANFVTNPLLVTPKIR